MIIGIGIDLIEIERIEKVFTEKKKLEKVFTEEEIRYSFSNKEPYLHLAARFCAKEAYYKCIGKGAIHFKEIEIRKMENGKPYIVLHGKTKEIWESVGSPSIFVSLSHSKTVATAVVVLEKKE